MNSGSQQPVIHGASDLPPVHVTSQCDVSAVGSVAEVAFGCFPLAKQKANDPFRRRRRRDPANPRGRFGVPAHERRGAADAMGFSDRNRLRPVVRPIPVNPVGNTVLMQRSTHAKDGIDP